jgi:hypothetical protein
MKDPSLWYVIVLDVRPWVLAEIVDDHFARDESHTWIFSVAIRRDEALLDPDFRGAIEEWDRGDHSAYAAWSADEEACIEIEDAEDRILIEARSQGDQATEAAVLDRPGGQPSRPPRTPEQIFWSNAVNETASFALNLMDRADQMRDGLGKELARVMAVQWREMAGPGPQV